MKDVNRDSRGRFIHGHKVSLLRNNKGRFVKKDKEKSMDKNQKSSMVEEKVDRLLKKFEL